MAFDPTAPADNSQVAAFPPNERAQRLATETLHDLEHDPTTGTHQFRAGDDTARGVISWPTTADKVALWAKDDEEGFEAEIQYKLGNGSWFGLRTELLARQNYWSASQCGTWLTAAAGSALTMDFQLGNFFRVTCDQDFVIQNPTMPTRPSSNPAGCFFLEIEQADGGAHDIASWGANFRFAGGLAPSGLTPGAGSIDLVQMVILYDGSVHAEIIRNSLA